MRTGERGKVLSGRPQLSAFLRFQYILQTLSTN